jgi:hypothetical protein
VTASNDTVSASMGVTQGLSEGGEDGFQRKTRCSAAENNQFMHNMALDIVNSDFQLGNENGAALRHERALDFTAITNMSATTAIESTGNNHKGWPSG